MVKTPTRPATIEDVPDEIEYLRVRNWEKYQDANLAAKYKETGGVLPWAKQMTNRLDDVEYTQLHPLSRYIWGECIGLAFRYGPNKLPNDSRWLQERMHASFLGKQFSSCLDELVERGFLQVVSIAGTESGTESGTSQSSEFRIQSIKSANADSSITDGIREIYDHWRTVRAKTDRRYAKRIAPERRSKIKARLREFSADELKRALDNVALDPWEDRPRHDDLTVLFRNQTQVEKFLALTDAKERREAATCPACGVGGGLHMAGCGDAA